MPTNFSFLPIFSLQKVSTYLVYHLGVYFDKYGSNKYLGEGRCIHILLMYLFKDIVIMFVKLAYYEIHYYINYILYFVKH